MFPQMYCFSDQNFTCFFDKENICKKMAEKNWNKNI